MPLSIHATELAARLREKRLARGLSLRQAAQEVGVSPTTFSRVERGDHLPDRENLLQLANWVGVTLEQIASSPADQNVVTHSPGESTVEAVALHLRADKDLDPKDAQILMEVFRVAYENLRKRHGNE
jgi:transcriptional regulator with XRE-family HTH domain